MKVILLDDVAKVGRRGEVRDVSDGYARNFLIPKKLALSASAGNLKNLEHIKVQQDSKAQRIKGDAEGMQQRFEALPHRISRIEACTENWIGFCGSSRCTWWLTRCTSARPRAAPRRRRNSNIASRWRVSAVRRSTRVSASG